MTENERLAKIEVQVGQNTKDIKEIKAENKVLHELTTSVKLIAQDMGGIKDDMKEVKKDVTDVKSQMDEVKNAEGNKCNKLIDGLKEKVIWVFLGGIALYVFNLIFPFMK